MDNKLDFAASESIMKIVHDHFSEEPEILEVAMYILSAVNINEAVLKGIMAKQSEIQGVAPHAVHMVQRFDNGLTLNKFWTEVFAVIKSQIALDSIKLNTLAQYIEVGESKQEPAFFQACSVILMSRLDALTIVAFLWKGVDYAEQFDARIRVVSSTMSREHQKYFKARGV